MIAYESEVNGGESHIALVRGDLCPSCPACMKDRPGFRAMPATRPAAMFSCGYGSRAYALHGRRHLRGRLPLPRSSRPIHAHDCGRGLRGDPLPAQHFARFSRSSRPRWSHPPSAFEPGGAVTPAASAELPRAGSSCTRNCAPAKARRPAPGASCAPSAWAARSSRTSASSASGCCRTRPCTFPRSKASVSRSSNRCASPSRNVCGLDDEV